MSHRGLIGAAFECRFVTRLVRVTAPLSLSVGRSVGRRVPSAGRCRADAGGGGGDRLPSVCLPRADLMSAQRRSLTNEGLKLTVILLSHKTRETCYSENSDYQFHYSILNVINPLV